LLNNVKLAAVYCSFKMNLSPIIVRVAGVDTRYEKILIRDFHLGCSMGLGYIKIVNAIAGSCAYFVFIFLLPKKCLVLQNQPISFVAVVCKIIALAQIRLDALCFSSIGAAKKTSPNLICQGGL
jgi:hypothetical protein